MLLIFNFHKFKCRSLINNIQEQLIIRIPSVIINHLIPQLASIEVKILKA